jgi:hypothetical protein
VEKSSTALAPVHGEVPAQGVFLNGSEDVVAQEHPRGRADGALLAGALYGFFLCVCTFARVRIAVEARAVVPTEGRDLDDLAPRSHMHDLEAAAHDTRAPEEIVYLSRVGTGGDVEILGRMAEQQVANATAHEIRLETGVAQRAHHLQGVVADQFRRDAVLARPVTSGPRRSGGLRR